MYFIIILIGVLFDQLLKFSIVENLSWGETSYELGFFKITYIRNEGAAFGILNGEVDFLSIMTAALIAALLVVLWTQRKKRGRLALWSISLIISGGIGNLIDRIARGYVVDYLSFWDFPVFNFADICVVVGAGLAFLYLIFFESKDMKNKNIEDKGNE